MKHLQIALLLAAVGSVAAKSEKLEALKAKAEDLGDRVEAKVKKDVAHFKERLDQVRGDVEKGWERAQRAVDCHIKNHLELKAQHERAAVIAEIARKAQEELKASPQTTDVKEARRQVNHVLNSAVSQKRHVEAHLEAVEKKSRDLCNASAAALKKNEGLDKHLEKSGEVFKKAAKAAYDAHKAASEHVEKKDTKVVKKYQPKAKRVKVTKDMPAKGHSRVAVPAAA